MKQITYFCDRCGKKLDRIYKIIGHELERETGDYLENVGVDLDFCSECYHEIMSDLTEMHEKEEVDEPDEEVDEEVDEPEEEATKPEKKVYDVKKMAALRKAGWTYKQIAEEFQCAVQTVANHLKKEGIK